MENAQTPDEGKKTVETPVTKPANSAKKPATARGSQAKSTTAKPSASAARKPAAKKPAAKKPAARKAPARTTTAAAKRANSGAEESTIPKPSAVAAKSDAASSNAAKSGVTKTSSGKSSTPKRPATKPSTAANTGTKRPASKGAKSPQSAASKKPASRTASARPSAPVTAAEDAERTLASSDHDSTIEITDAVVETEANISPVVSKPGAPDAQTPQPGSAEPAVSPSTSATPSASASGAAAADDDAEAEAEAEAEADADADAVAATASDAETSMVDSTDSTTESKATDELPAAEEKPDAVLAGLARLRALASQFAAPTAEAAAQKAAVQKRADEKAAADKAETDKFEAERAEAEKAEFDIAEPTADVADVADEPQAEADSTDAEAASGDALQSEEKLEAAEEDATQADAAVSTTAAPVEVEPETAAPEDEELGSGAPTIVAEPERDGSASPETDDANADLVAVDVAVSHGLEATSEDVVLQVNGLSKDFGDTVAVDDIRLSVRAGVFYGIVGPNGAGKTTTLSMITGLLRPDSGNATVNGVDVWESPDIAKRSIGVLPDRLRIFDRLTGSQLLYYSGVLRGLDSTEVRKRSADLATAFGLDDVMGRLVSDYSSGMLKKVALAAAMIHSPRLLVLDEPFESVDPVSAATVTRILKQYVKAGGTVLLSSHRMELVQRVCSHVAVIVDGKLLADGTIDEVRDGISLEDRFVQLTGKNSNGGGLEWLSSFSD